ncbi:unnamed protein product [Dibothriocephalus latus]|uniref:Aquaporin n=1 Tax=Dibothriocephalus latus TaxID=60516 RepID=A0A3P6QRZ2_DIBLA|nr:unnamed protein product [Dibothriocephalus latus]
MLRMHKVPEMTISNAWQIVRLCCSEVICTAILAFTIARSIENPPGPAAGFLFVPVSLFLGIWIGGPVSGGHINPVVTLVLCACRWVSFIYLPIYWLSQFVGVLVGMGLAHGFTLAMLNGTEPKNLTTDGLLGDFFWIHLAAETLTTTMFLLTVVSSADSKRPGNWTGSGFYTSLSVASMALIIGLFFDARIACFVNPIVPVGTAIVFGIKTGFWVSL